MSYPAKWKYFSKIYFHQWLLLETIIVGKQFMQSVAPAAQTGGSYESALIYVTVF